MSSFTNNNEEANKFTLELTNINTKFLKEDVFDDHDLRF